MATTDPSENRQAKRMPVTLKIKFKSETLNQFIERYSVDISHGGIFIRTKDPLAVGTSLRFEFQLKDATPLIKGEGTVVWTREHDPARTGVAPGMGVRFDRLPGESQRVLEQILEQKSSSADEVDDDEDDDDDGGFKDSPTRVAPAALVDKLVADDYSTRDSTPLPRPMPFHSDADDFPDETFEEATRVAPLDQLAASTKEGEQSDADDDADEDSAEDQGAEAAADDDDSEDEGATTSPVGPAVGEREPEQAEKAKEAEEGDDELAARRSSSPTSPPAASGDDESPADDGDDAGDEFEAAETEVAAATSERRAEVTAPAQRPDDGGGNMPWIAAAAVILLLAGAGGFWFMSKGRDKARAEAPPTTEEPAAAEMAAAEPPVAAEEAEPEVETVEIQIESEPAGATAELVGTDQRGTTPATFTVEPDKSYEVQISHPGHVAQVIEVEAGGELPVVELAPMKKVVRVTSTPPGAAAWVQGRRQRGTTPLEVELEGRLASAESLAVKLRKPGFEMWSESVPIGSRFTEEDGVLVQTVSAELARRQVARRPEPKPAADEPEAAEPAEDEGATTDDGAGAEPPERAAAKPDSAPPQPAEPDDSAPAKQPEASAPQPAEPEDSAPVEPQSAEQSAPKSTSSSAAAEPTPAWTD